ncbi:putative ribonuclease H-like domain-containing protein [Tanacetum coccineum]
MVTTKTWLCHDGRWQLPRDCRGGGVGDSRRSYYTRGHELKTVERSSIDGRLMLWIEEQTVNRDHHMDASQQLEDITNSNTCTNEADNTAYGISAAHTQSNPTSGDNLSDAVICVFLASQPNSPQLAQEDLEQIDLDDLEEMDLQWEMAMLIIKARRLDVNECRSHRNQENRGREINRRTVTVETPTENALVAQDGIGGLIGVPSESRASNKNFSLMAITSSGRSSSVQILRGLESVEARLAHDKKNEVVFEESINVLNLEVKLRDNWIVFKLSSLLQGTIDESNLWHMRLSQINIKNINKLVRGNLVRGLPLKFFENDHSCVACQKGKQHKVSYKTKLVNSISRPLHMLHMDLFGPTNVKSLMKKSYCQVVTDDFSRFSWVFFLATKVETSGILKTFITGIVNQLDHKVKVIKCDNGTEFKNSVMNQFCDMKGIKREFSVARTPQQNGVAERKNRTLIEATRTMVLAIKPHNKTPYELICGRPPLIDFMKPFGCPVTILNTRDHLGKFNEKDDEGYFVGYSVISKAIRVFNKRTRIVKETLNMRFLENAPNVKGNGPDWLFDVDSLSKSMNFVLVVAGNQTNGIAGTKDNIIAGQAQKEKEPEQEYILIPFCTTDLLISQGPKDSEEDAGMKPIEVNESGASDKGEEDDQAIRSEIIGNAYDDVEEEVDMNNVDTSYTASDAPFTKFLNDHPQEQEPKKVIQALKDPSWVEEMQDKLLQFKLLKVWTLVDLPRDKWAIGTK